MAVAGLFEDDGPLPMPRSVKEKGGAYSINYTSPMARYRISGKPPGQKTIQSLIPVAQIDPTVWENINIPEYVKIIAKAAGAPRRMMRSDKEIAEIVEERKTNSK